jgi:hypothetical protein
MTSSYINPPFQPRYKPGVFHRNMRHAIISRPNQSEFANWHPSYYKPPFRVPIINPAPLTHYRMAPRNHCFLPYATIPNHGPQQNANMRVNNYNCFQRNSHVQGRQKYQPTHYMNPPTFVVNNRQRPIRLQTHPFHNHAAPFNKSYPQAAVTERNVFPVPSGRTHTVP